MPVPNQFANVTTSIPLSQLDANFNTPITLGNTAIQLGNTVTTLNNMTLANVTISSGNVTITNVSVTTANVTTANIATANIATEIVTTSQTLNYGTANAVVYLNGSKVSTTGTALQFDGTNLGIGQAPSAFFSGVRGLDVGAGALVGSNGNANNGTVLWYNAFYNGTNTVYKYNGSAGLIELGSAGLLAYVAPSGSAGGTVSVTQVLSVDRAKTLALEGATSQAGTGITFPATQSASSNANTLDDYEEGTWTPAVRGSGTAGTYQLALANGFYTKIGRSVTIVCDVQFAGSITGGGTGYLQITGIPFSNASSIGSQGAVRSEGLDMATNYTWLTALPITSPTTTWYLAESGDNQPGADCAISGVSANDAIKFTATFFTT